MHASSGGGFSLHSSPSHSSGFSRVSGASHGGNFAHNPSRNSGVHIGGNSNFRRRGFNGRRYVYPYVSYYPYAGYYGGYYPYGDGYYGDTYNDQSYDQDSEQGSDAGRDSTYQGPYLQREHSDDRSSDVSRQVQTLNGKIDRLQADLDARSRPQSASEPATALVFRDRHVEEIRNYAISGGTLWVFGDQSAKKIPLAQLDLPATAKMNDERGVNFQIPR